MTSRLNYLFFLVFEAKDNSNGWSYFVSTLPKAADSPYFVYLCVSVALIQPVVASNKSHSCSSVAVYL